MKDTNTAMSYNPESNMKLSSGIAPVSIALQEGIRVGLGTDGTASNNNLNFFGEMNSGIKLQKLKYANQAITVQDMLYIGFSWRSKSFKHGKRNWVHYTRQMGGYDSYQSCNIPHMHPQYSILSHLVNSALTEEKWTL